MSKNLLQDMVKTKYSLSSVAREREVYRKDVLPPKIKQTNGGGKPRYTLWFVAIISILFFLFALSYLFFKAEVAVNPKIQDIILNENLSANGDMSAEILPFDLIVISEEEEKTIQTTGEKDVLEKAEGVVLIYNAFNSVTQRLDIDTRLEGSNGKIYKTKKQIIVPGMKGSTPGSVEVGIYATNVGTEYNSGPLDFSIVGFKGTPKYSKFYARSKGEITGGFKGKASIVSDTDKSSSINELKSVLQAKLLKKVTDQIPNGFILFKDATFLDTNENDIDLITIKGDISTIKLKGTLYGLLFNEEKITKKIVEDSVSDYDGSPVYLANIKDLNFSLLNKDSVSFGDMKNIDFSLKGAGKIVWKLDEKKLITDLLGKSKKDFKQILAQYPNVDSAELKFNLFWRMSFPDKIKDIKVIVNYPK